MFFVFSFSFLYDNEVHLDKLGVSTSTGGTLDDLVDNRHLVQLIIEHLVKV